MIGFMRAMISNLAFLFRNIFSKKGMKGKSVSGMNYYACLSMLSLLILILSAIAVDGPKMWGCWMEHSSYAYRISSGWKDQENQVLSL
ncbi:hypothetical protein ACFX13_013803 [Malus domestica]